MNFVVGDRVINRRSRLRGTVFEISKHWGWFRVRYESGAVRTYDGNLRKEDLAVRLDPDFKKESTNA